MDEITLLKKHKKLTVKKLAKLQGISNASASHKLKKLQKHPDVKMYEKTKTKLVPMNLRFKEYVWRGNETND